jgi:anti-sigma B factor antagonist
MMKIKVTKGDVDIVALIGAFDAASAPNLTNAVNKIVHAGQIDIVVDFSEVQFMSSAGLRAIVLSIKEARARGGDVRFAAISPSVGKIIQMSGLHNIIKIFPTVEEALASFG